MMRVGCNSAALLACCTQAGAGSDFLSSIEVLVMDRADVMAMQVRCGVCCLRGSSPACAAGS